MFGVTDKDIQFGRQASVIFDNYTTGESVLINDYSKLFDESGKRIQMLRVGFEFTKSLDENTNWSTGSVKIYGLTLETFNKLGDYLETEVEVQVGYEYSTTRKLDKLFRAVLIDKSYVVESGISVSTFNLQGYYFIANSSNSNRKISVIFPEKTSFISALSSIVDQTGFDGFTIDMTNIRTSFPSQAGNFAEYVSNLKFPFGKSYYGTPKSVLAKFCEEFGLGYVVNNENHLLMFFTQNKLEVHFSNMLQADVKLVFNNTKTYSKNTPKTEEKVHNFRNGTSSILLNGNTGLLGLPTVKTKTVTKEYSAAVEASEKAFSQKPSSSVSATGSQPKNNKTPKTKKVLRRSVEAVCLINTAIEPQGYVTLALQAENELNGDYRVRTVAIDGDTESGNWNMTLSLEGEW